MLSESFLLTSQAQEKASDRHKNQLHDKKAESSLNAHFEVTTCLVLGVPLVFV